MYNVTFKNKKTDCTYIRVNRRVALKAFISGSMLVVYGRMENPESSWNSPQFWSYVDDSDRIERGDIPDNVWKKYHFERLENAYEFYNNNKPWWYLPENVAKKYIK